jgi:3-hydroxy-3-methylglutaryl CoA synthase/uncharacterized OB-fold protein
MTRGIVAWGAYVPRARLERAAIAASLAWLQPDRGRAKGTRSYCHWDEDALTMAVEAARDCLGSAPRAVDALALASTTLPFADRSNAGLVAGALVLDERVRTSDVGGTLRAGTGALIDALAGRGRSLVIGSDARLAKPGSPQEPAYGHAAAALLVGDGAGAAEYLGGESLAADFVDHYRESGAEFDYTLEERWVRDEGYAKLVPPVVARALERAGVRAADVAHFVFPAAHGHGRRLAQQLGIPEAAAREPLADGCGDSGTAHPLLMLAHALEHAAPGQLLLVVGFGHGVDALLFRTTDRVTTARPARGATGSLASGAPDAAYVRYLAHTGLLALDFGMRAERDNRTSQSAFWRRHREVTGFVGGRCTACGTVQFPRSRACVNPDCRQFDTQVEAPLAEVAGKVKTYTEDWLAYSPSPPHVYGNVELDGGGNVFIEFTDVAAGELAVGAPLRFVFRVKDVERVRGFRRYFWKATPARDAAASAGRAPGGTTAGTAG